VPSHRIPVPFPAKCPLPSPNTTTTPPSLETRDGGAYCHLPTLLLVFRCDGGLPIPLSRSKRETEGVPATCPPPFSRFDTMGGFLSPSLARNVRWRGFLPTAHPPSRVSTRRQASYSLSTLPRSKREMEGLPATCPPPSRTSTPFLPTCPALPLLWNTTR